VLKEAFGEIVENTGSHLIKNGSQTLSDLTKGAQLEKEQVR